MNVAGIGSTSLNSYLVKYLYGRNTTTGDIAAADTLSLYQAVSGNYRTQGDSLHIELSLKDGSRLTIDYQSAGALRKTAYELGRYGNYTYRTDYFSSENTANRILDFARSLWDGSSEKLEILAKAIDQGVSEARQALGNIPAWLGNIIGRTEYLLHQGLEDMKNEIKKTA
jgi:hypothetical protein